MDYKFIQPVSMRVTQEQYERDLREPLLKMGYREYGINFNSKGYDYLATNFANYNNEITNLKEECRDINNRYFIPNYNPKLFLAIAAMTDSISPIVGEWIVYTDSMAEMCGLTAGELYRFGKLNTNTRYMRKASLKELINKFTNQKQDNMNTNFTTEELEKLRTLIAPKNKEEFDKLIGAEKPMFKKEEFITGDKVVLRDGNIYLVIRDCNASYYGAQVFVLVKCQVNGEFMISESYNEKLLHNGGSSRYDMMKIYRWGDGAIVGDSFSEITRNYKLIWERE